MGRPRGAYYETTEARIREAMGHALGAETTKSIAMRLAATALAPVLSCSTYEATRFLERARYLLDAGEILPDLLRRMNPKP